LVTTDLHSSAEDLVARYASRWVELQVGRVDDAGEDPHGGGSAQDVDRAVSRATRARGQPWS
jgi:hypothetical protein